MAKVIGIDLGTTNSCVAVMEGSHADGIIEGFQHYKFVSDEVPVS